MTEREIIELARKTRQAQKHYFATRSRSSLIASKQLERELDNALEDYTKAHPQLLIDLLFGDNEGTL